MDWKGWGNAVRKQSVEDNGDMRGYRVHAYQGRKDIMGFGGKLADWTGKRARNTGGIGFFLALARPFSWRVQRNSVRIWIDARHVASVPVPFSARTNRRLAFLSSVFIYTNSFPPMFLRQSFTSAILPKCASLPPPLYSLLALAYTLSPTTVSTLTPASSPASPWP